MAKLRPAEVLSAYCETFAGGGPDEALKYWHPDIEWRALGDAAEVVRGTAAMRRYYDEWTETIADLCGEVEEVVYEDDERVVALLRSWGRGRVSGVSASGTYYVACLVKDGRIVVGREYATSEDALTALPSLA